MPEYTYTDGENEIIVIHSMEWDGIIISGSGVEMWRKPPSGVHVNWNGPSPSQSEHQSPIIKDHIKNADRLRDEYLKNKEQRKE